MQFDNGRQLLNAAITVLLRCVPLRLFERIVGRLITLRVRNEEPATVLKFLFGLDNRIYTLAGQWAVAYDDGRHAKHRLTGYIAYFVDLARQAGGPYLDVGCHEGALAAALAAQVTDRVVGVEIDSTRVDTARRSHRRDNLSFVCADATKTELDGPFRTVILSNVLEHLEERTQFLRDLIARHKPRTFLIRVPNFERDWRVPLKQELGVEYRLDTTHEIEHRPDELRSELEGAGLRIVSFDHRWGEIWVVAEPGDRDNAV